MRVCRTAQEALLHGAQARSAFKGFRFPPEIIVLAVRWYLRYGLLPLRVDDSGP